MMPETTTTASDVIRETVYLLSCSRWQLVLTADNVSYLTGTTVKPSRLQHTIHKFWVL